MTPEEYFKPQSSGAANPPPPAAVIPTTQPDTPVPAWWGDTEDESQKDAEALAAIEAKGRGIEPISGEDKAAHEKLLTETIPLSERPGYKKYESAAYPEGHWWQDPAEAKSAEQKTLPAGEIAEIVSITDGDTFVAKLKDGTKGKFRLQGFDAPEAGYGGSTPDAIKAKQALTELLARGGIKINELKMDRYGRYVANIGVAGIPDVSAYMLEHGFGTNFKLLPDDRPQGNEWRELWRNIPKEERERVKNLTTQSRWFGFLGKKAANSPGIKEFQRDYEQMLEKYWRPLRRKRSSLEFSQVAMADTGWFV